jgi:hypothetical protein
MTRLDFVRTETNSNQVWLKSSHKSTRKEILIKYFFTTSLNRGQRSFFLCRKLFKKKRKSQPGFENFENFEPWSQR